MKFLTHLITITWLWLCASPSLRAAIISSPDGRLQLQYEANSLVVRHVQDGKSVAALTVCQLGLGTNGADAAQWRFEGAGKVKKIKARYEMLAGKRSHCRNEANEVTLRYLDATGRAARCVVRLYNDGLAFRYELDGLQQERIGRELTAYRIEDGTPRWVQRYDGGYENFYPRTTHGKGERGNTRWAYPALLQPAENTWVLLTEAAMEANQSASWLDNREDERIYRVVPDRNALRHNGTWVSPWRVAIVGTLADVVESTLVTDVSPASRIKDTSWIKPGVVSWIYWAYNHGSKEYPLVCKYIDFAAQLRLPYMLIDAEWDEMRGGGDIEDALAYAKAKNVRPLIWYNSSTGWINGAPGPKWRLNNPDSLEREFAWLERVGVAGVKIDFFDGDNQPTMDYYIRLLEAGARHHLLVNFHGATIPRGWQRTYPHLLSTEGVYGAEWYNNLPVLTDRAAAHNATLPFTRNVVGPMDYTPCAFSDSQHPHITTDAHELALTALFESALQHLADRPESILAQPQDVCDFLSTLPAAWDDTRLLGGMPGDWVVLARRSGSRWYIAGINGRDEARTLDIDYSRLGSKVLQRTAHAFTDGSTVSRDGRERVAMHIDRAPLASLTQIRCAPRGGFVLVVE